MKRLMWSIRCGGCKYPLFFNAEGVGCVEHLAREVGATWDEIEFVVGAAMGGSDA